MGAIRRRGHLGSVLSSDPAKKDLKKDTEKHRLARGGPRVRRALERVRVRAVPASPAPIYVNAGHELAASRM